MPYTLQSAGTVLAASFVNAHWEQQVIVQCTSGTRPASPVAGMTVYETDTFLYSLYDGGQWLNITPKGARVTASEATTSTTYTDLTTAGPAVTVLTGGNGRAEVALSAQMYNTGGGTSYAYASFAVSGATTLAATDSVLLTDLTGWGACAQIVPLTGLTAGVNTFTTKYRVNASTGNFMNRSITVTGIP